MVKFWSGVGEMGLLGVDGFSSVEHRARGSGKGDGVHALGLSRGSVTKYSVEFEE